VQLNHGGTEMGQGLFTKMMAVCADGLGVPVARVRQMPTSTEKVPNTSPTAASSGSDLNGAAVAAACATLRGRMAPVAADLLGWDGDPAELVFADDRVLSPLGDAVAFPDVAKQCWLRRVSLSSTGFYATPGIAYDAAAGRGTPFFYYAYGVALVEVELCGLTGEQRLRRVDILHDVGDSLVPTIDRGQIEGAFVQGLGWLTDEQVLIDTHGAVRTLGPSTYKVPSVGDVPRDFRVTLLDRAAQPGVVGGSKAVGEPPFMLAIAVLGALEEAVAAFGPHPFALALPAHPEHLLRAVEAARGLEAPA
jgi:xanthine dehydrogenase large subunit